MNLQDIRSVGNSLTPQEYLKLITKESATYAVVNPTQWAYLEQAGVYKVINIPALNIEGTIVLRIRDDN